VSASYGDATYNFAAHSNNPQPVYLALQKSRGTTTAAYVATTNNDYIASLSFRGVNSANASSEVANITVQQVGAATATTCGSKITFNVSNAGATPATAITIDPAGNVCFGTTSPTSKLQVVGLPTYATNALAVAAGLTAGAFYILTGTNALQVVQ
jgi:hypothetical protein